MNWIYKLKYKLFFRTEIALVLQHKCSLKNTKDTGYRTLPNKVMILPFSCAVYWEQIYYYMLSLIKTQKIDWI